MRYVMFAVVASLMFCSGIALATGVSRDTTERVRQLGEQATKLVSGKVGEYAKDALGVAQASISAAQIAIAAGNEKEAIQKAELADLQLMVATAKAGEKELAEQVAVQRAELKRLEAQLERTRQGGEN
jgi:hypothetical protein